MTTVGYGDIIPASIYETIYVTISLLISSWGFSYSLNTIGNILADLKSHETGFVEQMRKVIRYMNQKQIDLQLQIDIRKYLKYKYEAETYLTPSEEGDILDSLNI